MTQSDVPAKGRPERSRRTRNTLRDALLELLQTKPLEQIRLRDFTSRSGVTYATYFRNYEDKEALLQDPLSYEIKAFLAMTMPLFFFGDGMESTQALQIAADQADNDSWVPGDLAVSVADSGLPKNMVWWLTHENYPSAEDMAVAPVLELE